ncbi:MAG: methyltransferase domain-containing protein [Luteibaculaceae bacterium]
MNKLPLPLSSFCCPACYSKLEATKDALVCSNVLCAATYPITQNGIPILIDNEKSIFCIEDFTAKNDTFFSADYHKGSRLMFKKLAPDISHNYKARENLSLFVSHVSQAAEKPVVLVIGGGIKGEGFEVFDSNKHIEIVASDVSFGPETQVIADGHALPFVNGLFDGVIVQAVLEHVLNPTQVVAEMVRVLKPSGYIYAETPFMQQVHGGAYDFQRFTKLGHRWLLRDFDEIKSGVCCGTGMAFAWSYEYLILSFSSHTYYQKTAKIFTRFTGFWLKYLDFLLHKTSRNEDAASAFYFLGKKNQNPLSHKEIIGQFRTLKNS